MKKKHFFGILVSIIVLSLISLSYAKDDIEKASTLISRALKSANEGDYEKMVELCTEAIEIAPNYSLGYLTRATAYSALGRHEKARADYLKTAELAEIEANKATDLAGRDKKGDTAHGVNVGGRVWANRKISDAADDIAYSIYFRPGVRFGTDSRTLYIMDLLVPLYRDEKNILFGNIKYTPNDRSGWEINAGMGYRRLLWDEKLILGANAYYDRRKTDWGTDHEQWGVGLEAMADIPLESFAFDLGLTARLNYYHPLSDTKIDGLGTPYAKYTLSDSGIIFESGRVEEPMRGFDYELGMRIPYLSDYIETWAYAGGYHYHGRLMDDVNGFMARLEVIPTDFMRLNYEFHHDNYSKDQHYGEVTFEVPFSIGNLVTGKNPFEGIGDVFTGSRELSERMVEPVRRDVDVKVIVDEENENVPGAGDQIEDIVFVSETGSDAPGNGTKDNPYATVSYALANDPRIIAGSCTTIHVMNSSTTAVIDEAAAPGSLTLSIANFLLWGSGANHPKYANILNMPYKGHPTINDTLELNAANPEVTGLGFDVTGSDYCIDILAGAGGSGIKITNNLFEMSRAGDAHGIHSNIAGSLGTEQNPIIIANNSFNIRSTVSTAYGIDLRNVGAGNDIFAKITNNDMSWGIWGNDYAYGIYLYSGSAGIGTEISPVTVSGNRMAVTGRNSNAYGIRLNSENDLFAVITNNDMSGGIWGDDYAYGIYLSSFSGGIGTETSPLIISGNPMAVTSSNGNANGMDFGAMNDIFADITNNDMSKGIWGDYAYGISLSSINGGIGSQRRPAIVSGNRMIVGSDLISASGISLYADDDIFAAVTNNDMSGGIWSNGSGADCIYIVSNNGNLGSETRPVIVSGNRMIARDNNNSAYGIYLYADGDLFVGITGNEMKVISPSNAVGVYSLAIGDLFAAVTGNEMELFAADDAYGVFFQANGDLFAAVTDNEMEVFAADDASGAYLRCAAGAIGSLTAPTLFQNNSGLIVSSGGNDSYLLELDGGIASSYVNWTGNSFDVFGGVWSGNYPGANGPVYLNGYGGIITP